MIITNVKDNIFMKNSDIRDIMKEIFISFNPRIESSEESLYYHFGNNGIEVRDIIEKYNISEDEKLFVNSIVGSIDSIVVHYLLNRLYIGIDENTSRVFSRQGLSQFLYTNTPILRFDNHKISDLHNCDIATIVEKSHNPLTIYDSEYRSEINRYSKEYLSKFDGLAVCIIDLKYSKRVSINGKLDLLHYL